MSSQIENFINDFLRSFNELIEECEIEKSSNNKPLPERKLGQFDAYKKISQLMKKYNHFDQDRMIVEQYYADAMTPEEFEVAQKESLRRQFDDK